MPTTTEDAGFAAGPSKLDRPGTDRLTWHHTIRAGRDWRDALRPEYWYACARLLGPGHRIEILSHDRRVMFEAICLEANPDSTPTPRVDLYFVPIMPRDLDLPAAPMVTPSRWVARQMTTGGAWEVIDEQSGEAVQQSMHRAAAQQLVGHLESVAAEVERANPRVKPAARLRGRKNSEMEVQGAIEA